MSERGQEIGSRIAQAREAAGLTQAQLADVLDVTPRMIQHYENGSSIPYKYLDRLEQLFDVSLGWLMYGSGEPVGLPVDADLLADRHDALMAKLDEIAADVRTLLASRKAEA